MSGWTPLPPIALRVQGPGLFESLEHYALRMADTCGVSRKLLASILRTGSSADSKVNAGIYHSSWTGPQSSYATLLFPLMEMTGQANLFKGTFHSVSGVLGMHGATPNASGGGHRRWCPSCYLEWDDRTSSEPLIWAFSVLTICPVHAVALESKCQHCGAEQRSYRSYRVRRTCVACRKSLASSGRRNDPRPVYSWIDRILVNFARFISAQDLPVSINGYLQFREAMWRRVRSGEQFPPAVHQFIKLNARGKNMHLPTIAHLLNLCAFQGCEIEDILVNPISAAAKPLFERTNGFGRVPFPQRTIKASVSDMGRCMVSLLEAKNFRLPSIATLCNQFGVWLNVVRDNYPDVYGQYTQRYEQQSDFTRVHVRRAFDCAFHLLHEVAYRAAPVVAGVVAERSRVSIALAADCVATVAEIERIRSESHEHESDLLSVADEFGHWMRGTENDAHQ